ncbi:MAG: crotonase/enoyl-CoA hydratase family protein [Ilumatobacteraceae bacterium]
MSSVRTDTDGPVRIITIDRPDVRNAVDRPTADALADAFRSFEHDDEALVAVLTGAGGTFCAGADLKGVSDGRGNRVVDDMSVDGPMGPSRMAFTKPVIAAVEGFAVAGGLELALLCDLRVAADDAVFGVYCRRWGVPLIDGGTIRLPRLIGHSHALDLILTGRGVSGDEAARWGSRTASPHRGTPRRCDRTGEADRRVPAAACARIAGRAMNSGACRSTTLSPTRPASGLQVIAPGETLEGPAASPAARAGTVSSDLRGQRETVEAPDPKHGERRRHRPPAEVVVVEPPSPDVRQRAGRVLTASQLVVHLGDELSALEVADRSEWCDHRRRTSASIARRRVRGPRRRRRCPVPRPRNSTTRRACWRPGVAPRRAG